MHFGHDEIFAFASDIWSQMLSLELQPSGPVDLGQDCLTGCIHVAGEWQGAIVIVCPRVMIETAASVMFEIPRDEVATPQLVDALGELTNMLGGNLKALLPQPCYLSLPTVTHGKNAGLNVMNSQCLIQEYFVSGNLPIIVAVLESNEEKQTFVTRTGADTLSTPMPGKLTL